MQNDESEKAREEAVTRFKRRIEEDSKRTTEIPNKIAWIRKTAKTLGIVVAVIGLPWAFLNCLGNIQSDWNTALIYVSILCLARWLVLVAAIYLPFIGGPLFILDGVLLAWFTWDTIGLPPLPYSLLLTATGILFILSWILERKYLQTSDD